MWVFIGKQFYCTFSSPILNEPLRSKRYSCWLNKIYWLQSWILMSNHQGLSRCGWHRYFHRLTSGPASSLRLGRGSHCLGSTQSHEVDIPVRMKAAPCRLLVGLLFGKQSTHLFVYNSSLTCYDTIHTVYLFMMMSFWSQQHKFWHISHHTCVRLLLPYTSFLSVYLRKEMKSCFRVIYE